MFRTIAGGGVTLTRESLPQVAWFHIWLDRLFLHGVVMVADAIDGLVASSTEPKTDIHLVTQRRGLDGLLTVQYPWYERNMTMKESFGTPDFIPQVGWTGRCMTDLPRVHNVTQGKCFPLVHDDSHHPQRFRSMLYPSLPEHNGQNFVTLNFPNRCRHMFERLRCFCDDLSLWLGSRRRVPLRR